MEEETLLAKLAVGEELARDAGVVVGTLGTLLTVGPETTLLWEIPYPCGCG